jgi:hypothetical protein
MRSAVRRPSLSGAVVCAASLAAGCLEVAGGATPGVASEPDASVVEVDAAPPAPIANDTPAPPPLDVLRAHGTVQLERVWARAGAALAPKEGALRAAFYEAETPVLARAPVGACALGEPTAAASAARVAVDSIVLETPGRGQGIIVRPGPDASYFESIDPSFLSAAFDLVVRRAPLPDVRRTLSARDAAPLLDVTVVRRTAGVEIAWPAQPAEVHVALRNPDARIAAVCRFDGAGGAARIASAELARVLAGRASTADVSFVREEQVVVGSAALVISVADTLSFDIR